MYLYMFIQNPIPRPQGVPQGSGIKLWETRFSWVYMFKRDD